MLRAELPRARRPAPRNTIGIVNCPPDMWRILAALLMIWSIATSEKFQVMNSMIGRSPIIAAPMPTPAKPHSAMGVSITRFSPNFSQHALRHLVGALVVADLFAHEEDALVALHLLGHRLVERFSIRIEPAMASSRRRRPRR